MARWESARSVRQGCFLPEWRSPFGRVTAKQRQSAVPAAVIHLPEPRWQAKSRVTPRAMLPAHSRVMRRALLQTKSPVKPNLVVWTAGWRPPLLGPQD
jgi:hypothetical protein